MRISEGVKEKALKCVVYGPEGVGKTTFASKFPNPLFIDTEGGTSFLDVRRVDPAPRDWNDILLYVSEIANTPGLCETLVLDTMDWAEQLCLAKVCEEHDVDGIERIPYGKGFTYASEKVREFMNLLTECADRGVNVVVLAHAQIKKFEQPDEQGAYDRWELKLSKKCAPILKEWCDLLLFANFQTDLVKDEDGRYRRSGGKRRVMYASHSAAYDAKNRLGLPDELPFEFAAIAEKVPTGAVAAGEQEPAPESAPAATVAQGPANVVAGVEFVEVPPDPPRAERADIIELEEAMAAYGVTDAQLMREVGEGRNNPYAADTPIGNYDPGFVRGVLLAHMAQIAEGIRARAEYESPVPFD